MTTRTPYGASRARAGFPGIFPGLRLTTLLPGTGSAQTWHFSQSLVIDSDTSHAAHRATPAAGAGFFGGV